MHRPGAAPGAEPPFPDLAAPCPTGRTAHDEHEAAGLAGPPTPLFGVPAPAEVAISLCQDSPADDAAGLPPPFGSHERPAAHGADLRDRRNARLRWVAAFTPVLLILRERPGRATWVRAKPPASTAADVLIFEIRPARQALNDDDHLSLHIPENGEKSRCGVFFGFAFLRAEGLEIGSASVFTVVATISIFSVILCDLAKNSG
ncbi:hypothetical protein [Bradyrhizobium sp. USDA 4506]